ncbi:hypothetical protein F5880DRAFT_1613789 [Lentinula raphanica]|nr:hypothetical protein F5880DRAFT_1613789 [Lentinula raphanica]
MPPPFAQPFPIPYQKIYLYICSIKMCYWRRVRNIYTRCGHGVNLPEEESTANLVRRIDLTVLTVPKRAGNSEYNAYLQL